MPIKTKHKKKVAKKTTKKKIKPSVEVGTVGKVGKVVKKRPGYFGKRFRTEDSGEIRGGTKTSKILGYCVCGLALSKHDHEEGKKTIVICPRCGTRTRQSRLLLEPQPEPNAQSSKKPKSKRDYMDTGDFEDVDIISAYADKHTVSKTPVTSKNKDKI